eukprot:TRINITY_DN6276_c0_g1_i1.p2 TRINITY_DN6276_c0_g1~~TRINITY_DN6276_c0_g1_i1.p2  ORF type:complete len:107 (-),score=45.95 TRINITY_DN6276_c0_g1_i1:94-414(-)
MVKKSKGKKKKSVWESTGAELLKSDMQPELQEEIVSAARAAFDAVDVAIGKDIATSIKQAMDDKYRGTTWHCIVGKHFAVSITHSTRHLCYFKLDGFTIVVFKSDY